MPWTEKEIASRDFMIDRRVRAAIELAKNYQEDPERGDRIRRALCPVCFYQVSIAGQGFTRFVCASCDIEQMNENTNVPKLCLDCSKRLMLCRQCGGHYATYEEIVHFHLGD